jgi:hypothetical protein
VSEALVPLPRLVVPTSNKIEELYYLHIEDIELIGASNYLGKKATMTITNPYDSVLNLRTRTVLIQLSQTDDSEQSMLTRLSGEDDEVDAFDLHVGGVLKLDGASDIGVKLSEKHPSTGHVMGGAGVKAPPVSLVVAGDVVEEAVCSGLIKVDESRCDRCCWR